MNFISKLMTRPRSLILSLDDMDDPSQVSSPTTGTTQNQESTIQELLGQINDNLANQATSGVLSTGNQKPLTPKTPQIIIQSPEKDAVNLGLSLSSESLNENFCNVEDRNKLNSLFAGQSFPSLGRSPVSSITSGLDSIASVTSDDIDDRKSSSLSIPQEPESSSSHVSSDNETYVECRSFSPDTNLPGDDSNCFTSALDLASIAGPAHGWDDLVTSVTDMNMDSLENTREQLDMTPTECTSSDVMNLVETTELYRRKASESMEAVSSSSEHMAARMEENISLDTTTSMPRLVISEASPKIASVIENVDANICERIRLSDLESSEEEQAISSNYSLPEMSSELSLGEKIYCNNETIEADKLFSTDSNASVESANVTQESEQNQSVVLSWAAVEQNLEKLSTSTISQNDVNTSVNSPSDSTDAVTPIHSPNPSTPKGVQQQFPVKPSPNQVTFPKSPTKDTPAPDFGSPTEPIDKNTLPESEVNPITIITNTDNNPVESMNNTFSDGPVNLNTTTNVNPTILDKTFDGCSTENHPSDRRSLSPAINDQTVDMGRPNEVNNVTRTFEPMDVDIASPGPSETTSFHTLPSATSDDSLSEKEKCDPKDEKDVLVETISNLHNIEGANFSGHEVQPSDLAADEEFQTNRLSQSISSLHRQPLIFLNPSDFDFLLTKGNSNVEVDRSSLLLRFDPLLGHSVPVTQPVKAGSSSLSIISSDRLQQPSDFVTQNRLSPTNEEEEHFYDSNRSSAQENGLRSTQSGKPTQQTGDKPSEDRRQQQQKQKQKSLQITARSIKKNAKMSVDVIQDMKIENDCKSIEEIDTQSDEKQNFKMDELEKKIKNEVLKTEDIEKKLKEAEQREEALIKRITEKDKTITKMNGVIEAYEKAIAELIAEKEQIIQNYEKQLTEVKTDRDSNYHHLTSLETTFSDLHVKYEKSKEMTAQLKNSEESLLAEKRQNLENLRLQEQRYEKMKNHAMQQLEIANKKLESLTKVHSMEITKLKALLKKEEISRASIQEQLQQKSRENEELVKICDELINGQGS